MSQGSDTFSFQLKPLHPYCVDWKQNNRKEKSIGMLMALFFFFLMFPIHINENWNMKINLRQQKHKQEIHTCTTIKRTLDINKTRRVLDVYPPSSFIIFSWVSFILANKAWGQDDMYLNNLLYPKSATTTKNQDKKMDFLHLATFKPPSQQVNHQQLMTAGILPFPTAKMWPVNQPTIHLTISKAEQHVKYMPALGSSPPFIHVSIITPSVHQPTYQPASQNSALHTSSIQPSTHPVISHPHTQHSAIHIQHSAIHTSTVQPSTHPAFSHPHPAFSHPHIHCSAIHTCSIQPSTHPAFSCPCIQPSTHPIISHPHTQ